MLRRVNFYLCFAFGSLCFLIYGFLDGFLQPNPTNPYDGSPDIDEILDKTRSKIKIDLLNYNFTNSAVHKLEDLILEAPGKPVRSVIISTWRSGTSFLGEVVNAMPGNFYHYEPLSSYGVIQIRGAPHADNAISTIKKLLKCDFSGMGYYFEYGKKDSGQFQSNTRLWDHCKYNKELCFDANFTARFCKLFPFQAMKVVRVRLNLIQDILEGKELNTKVVFLIRDPRGTMQSRQHCSFCPPAADCWKPELLCADMISDYVAAGRLIQKYPDQLMVLRYEELALSPNVTTHQLLKFLRLGATQRVDEFLHTHTNMEVAGESSSFRVSRDVPFRWKNLLEYSYVEEIQGACKEAMTLWGYKMANNVTHLTSKEFYPLEPYTITL